jgi:hypothetical protein
MRNLRQGVPEHNSDDSRQQATLVGHMRAMPRLPPLVSERGDPVREKDKGEKSIQKPVCKRPGHYFPKALVK